MRIENPALQGFGQIDFPGRGGAPKVSPTEEQGQSFGEALVEAIKEVNATQQESREIQTDYMTGRRPVEMHELMIAMEKSSTATQLALSVRNKALEAYQEINRMQV